MMTKRSSHMPTLTTSDMKKRHGTLVRSLRDQRVFGAITLQRMRAQYQTRTGRSCGSRS